VNAKLVSISVLVGLVVLFILQNVAVVDIQFLFWSIQMPGSVLMFVLLVTGVIIGWFLHNHFKIQRVES
jgi:putative membrane protein